MKEKFCDMLKRLRKENNLTLKELEKKSGISYVEIHNLEANKSKPSAKTIAKLSKALNCDYGEMFDSIYY